MPTSSNHNPSDWAAEAVAELPALVPYKEAASFLHCCGRTLRRHVTLGRLRAVRPDATGSSRVLILRSSIAEFLRNSEEGAA